MNSSLVAVENLSHRYGSHQALKGLDLDVQEGEIFALLGPNGSGKSTLFRLMTGMLSIQEGDLRLFGMSLRSHVQLIRSRLGVVFQSPSLDAKLTVEENIRCQADLYGVRGEQLKGRLHEVVQTLGIADRLTTRCGELSGGLKRRVELAKGILHRPQLLLMDEPSTGLDPSARLDLWHALRELRRQSGVTVLLTTHLMEEADKADRVAILHEGKRVADGSPAELRLALGEQVLKIQASPCDAVSDWLRAKGLRVQQIDQHLRASGNGVAGCVGELVEQFGSVVQSVTVGQPGLEDVFAEKTGHRYWRVDDGGN